MERTMSPNEVGVELTQYLMPFISALLILVITLWFKDFATKIAKGLAFSMNKSFNEGDAVILDGNEAIIVKIGLTETVFGTYGERGYTWRYVPNERIPMLKLEKVINRDLHLDTDIEKAQKMQDVLIKANKEMIEANGKEIQKMMKE
tara:strand:+ start:841 stop:1281 length:441 start_codon:yes stop_codon:yes gene_type:complete